MIKLSTDLVEAMFFNTIKTIHDMPTANITLSGEKLIAFSKIRNKIRCLLMPFLLQYWKFCS